MGKFESYPEADSLNDSDITLYNKNSVTHKITFSRLVSLIKNKIAATGLVTSITTGVGLVSGTITSSGLIKCKLKSETPSSLSSTTISTTANRQYAVGVDKEGNLSVNVPWQENSTYQNGTAINIVNDTINVVLDDTYTSTSTVKAATANAVRKAYNNVYNNSMRTDGSNASRHVHFPTALTVGIIDPSNPISIGDNSVCFGYENTIGGSSAFASGVYTEAKGFASHSEGHGTNETNYTNGEYQEYNNNARANIAATATGAHVEGYTEYDGQSTITGIIQANGNGSHAEGCAIGGQDDGIIIASGKGAHAEGYANCTIIGGNCATIASGDGSHAEGAGTTASATASHAEGFSTTASGQSSHAEGTGTTASGDGSHAEGINTTASKYCSHAEGAGTNASGNYSHAEGDLTTASGTYSHAEGVKTTASLDGSHAEGILTTASGWYAHSEGRSSSADGETSHAEGINTTAHGAFSHAGGAYVTVAQKCQFGHGGWDSKFGNLSSYGRGVFCVSPNTLNYTSNATLSFPNGISITANGGVSLTITLSKYSMYVLYWATYSDEDDSVINSGMHYIATSKNTDNPLVQDMWSNNIIDSVSAGSITISDTHKYMFHLMRIL